MKAKISAIILVIVSLSTACNLNLTYKKDPLEGGRWVLVSIGGDTDLIGNPPSVDFEGGKISGNAGCNSYQGSYAVEGDSLEIGLLVRTEIYCQDPPGVMEQEDRFLEILAAADSYVLSAESLVIAGEGNVLEFHGRE